MTSTTKEPEAPKWTREELILALELYQSTDRVGVKPGKEAEAVSKTLRSLSIHDGASDLSKFRSVASVVTQANQFAKLHDEESKLRGKPSKKMEDLWSIYGHRPEATRTMAAAVRSAFAP